MKGPLVHSVLKPILLSLLAGCTSSAVESGSGLADYKRQDHYKAFATNNEAGGAFGYSYEGGSPWIVAEIAIETCEHSRQANAPECRITWIGSYDVSRLSPLELEAALFDYWADVNSDPTRLSMLEEVTLADAADGRPSVGAMAVVPKQGRRYWGLAIADAFAEAREQAVGECGSRECYVVSYFLPGQCVWVIQGETQVFWGAEPRDSVGWGLDYCELVTRNCQLVRHECVP